MGRWACRMHSQTLWGNAHLSHVELQLLLQVPQAPHLLPMPRTTPRLLLSPTASKCCRGGMLHRTATVRPAAAAASCAVAGFNSIDIRALPNGRQGWVQGPSGVEAPLLHLLLLLLILLLAVAGGPSCCLWLGRQLELVFKCMQLLQLADRTCHHGCERALPAGSPCR